MLILMKKYILISKVIGSVGGLKKKKVLPSSTDFCMGSGMYIFMPQSIVDTLSNANLFILTAKGVFMDVKSRICEG